MLGAYKNLITYFSHQYKDFKPTPYDKIRTRTLLLTMNRKGKMIRNDKRKKEWMGLAVTRLMARAMFDLERDDHGNDKERYEDEGEGATDFFI